MTSRDNIVRLRRKRAAALIGGADPKPTVEQCRRRVYNLWPEITRLAEALLQLKVMYEAKLRVRRGCRLCPGYKVTTCWTKV